MQSKFAAVFCAGFLLRKVIKPSYKCEELFLQKRLLFLYAWELRAFGPGKNKAWHENAGSDLMNKVTATDL